MIIPPAEHRPASNERLLAERKLESLGWSVAKLPRTDATRNSMLFIDMMKWCEDNVGVGRVEIHTGIIDDNDMWYSFSWYGYWNFWFRNEQDATLFALRWA